MPMTSEPVQITWACENDARKELNEFREIAAFLNGYKAARHVAESIGVKPWSDFPKEPDFTYLESMIEDLATKTAE